MAFLGGVKSQNGFIQAYDYYGAGMAFHNMLLVEDTLVVFGTAKHPELPKWGIYFGKIDTLGNILDYRVHYDPDGDSYSVEPGYEMIKTRDGGYAMVGQTFFRGYPILMKLDMNGDLEFVREYQHDDSPDIRHWNIVELENGGYMTTGIKWQPSDGEFDTFIMRTDEYGERMWEVGYGEFGLVDLFRGIRKQNNNEFLITGATGVSTPIINPPTNSWVKAVVIKIDTLGDITWEWESERTIQGMGSAAPFAHIHPATDGNWVSTGYFNVIREVYDEPTLLSKGEIVKRDTNFNVIWRTGFGQPTNTTNGFTDTAQTPDGGWVAVGRYTTDSPSGYDGYRASMIAKVNAQGDSLWSRTDTLFSPLTTASDPYLSGVVVLPSGSIITCGKVDKTWPSPGKSWAWLIKVDKHGCMEPGCNPTTNTENLSPLMSDFALFPNPVRNRLQVSGSDIFDVQMYDVQGRVWASQSRITENAALDVSHVPAGVYFVKITQGRAMMTKSIIKQ